MQIKDWRVLAELVGIAAIVSSLFFVGLQISQSRDVALSELDVALNANDIELAATIGDHADIWIKGNAGAQLDAPELAFYRRLIGAIAGRYRSSWRRNMRFGRVEVARFNAADFAIFLHDNPGAKRTWTSNQENMDKHLPDLGLKAGGSLFGREVLANLEKFSEDQNQD